MLQLFRSFQVAGIFILLAFTALLRAPAFVVGMPAAEEGILNPLGRWFASLWTVGGGFDWLLGVVFVTLFGFGASFTLQHYRLSDAGMFPGFVASVLGSAIWWWLGFSPLLIGAFLIGYAVYRLYECYRHQGISLPVFDAGLVIGCAWLIAPGFLWFLPGAIIGLAQLRRFRFTDFFGIIVGVLVPVVLFGTYRFLTNSLHEFLWIEDSSGLQLTASLFQIPDIAELQSNWTWFGIMVIASVLAFVGLPKLTTRRPIQEQRFNRLVYLFLAAGWLAIIFSGPIHSWSFAYILLPISTLLGIWLSELSRKPAEIITTTVLLLVVGGFLWKAFI